ncbi:hypothetical protein M3J09_008673 [Ascochyta lentis]
MALLISHRYLGVLTRVLSLLLSMSLSNDATITSKTSQPSGTGS